MVVHCHNFLRVVTISIVAVVLTARHVLLAAGQGDGFTNAFFGSKPLYHIDITLPSAAIDSLRTSPRKYVSALIRSEGVVYPEVGLHLKGSTGSFRPIDDKPCFTMEFDRFGTNRWFENQTKIHLNNSVEDPSYLSEQVGAEYFRAAGIPAANVAHALVTLNGRALGLYVVVEGLTPGFYSRYFSRSDGPTFEKDFDPDEKAFDDQLSPLANAAAIPDLEARWRRIGEILDRDHFVDFLAIETAVVHRDGYGAARNNFRLYLDPATGRFTFMPHGMDQLFAPANFPVEPRIAGTLARSILAIPDAHAAYRRKLVATAAVLAVGTNRVFILAEQLHPYLDSKRWREVSTGAGDLAHRITARAVWLQSELTRTPPVPIEFSGQPILVADRFESDNAGGGFAATTNLNSGVYVLRLESKERSAPCWRAQVLLNPGRYRLEGRVKTVAAKGLPFGNRSGVALRVLGTGYESNWLSGDSDWQPLNVEFSVVGVPQVVRLAIEMRATSGEAFIERNSLQLSELR